RIETDGAFPQRINVNVAQIKPAGVRLKTWERGAGLTRACGTGACATAVAAIKTKRASSPVTVSMSGGSLTIAWEAGQPIRLRGRARPPLVRDHARSHAGRRQFAQAEGV